MAEAARKLHMAEAARKLPPIMHDTDKQDYLAQAERHIAIVQDRVARQKRIIDKLGQAGQDTDCAVSMLHALETCVHAFEQHRERIFEPCET
jgi:hypothetical protein